MNNIESLVPFIPEFIIVAFGIIVIIVDLKLKPTQREWLAVISLLGLVASLISVIALFPNEAKPLFASADTGGMAAYDPFAYFFKILIILSVMATILISIKWKEVLNITKGEYYAILMVMTLGMFLMASSTNALMIVLSIEIVSISSYILAGFLGNARASEASFKYVIYGAVSSGIMLFGVSLTFGLTGTGNIYAISDSISKGSPYSLTLLLAVIFLFVGFGYKIASVPFHMWSPDVYEGAPIPITALLSVASKSAGFAVLIRFFYAALAQPVSGMSGSGGEIQWQPLGGVEVPWMYILAIISALTMTFGNLSAFPQENLKRLLAYSSIAHGGYMLMTGLLLTQGAIKAVLFYAFVYMLMNFGAFYVVMIIADRLKSEYLEAYRGLGHRAPFLAVMMTIFLLSLIGLPPLAGFIGKLYLFAEVIKQEWYWLAIVGVVNSVISLYYYARIIKTMFIDEPKSPSKVQISPANVLILLLFAVPTLLFGIYWTPLERLTQISATLFLGK